MGGCESFCHLVENVTQLSLGGKCDSVVGKVHMEGNQEVQWEFNVYPTST